MGDYRRRVPAAADVWCGLVATDLPQVRNVVVRDVPDLLPERQTSVL